MPKESLLCFLNDAPVHSLHYRFRRFFNWFPLGLGYASMIFMRYCMNTAQNALADDNLMSENQFYQTLAYGSAMYVVGFFTFGRLVDRKGGRWGMLVGMAGTIITSLMMSIVTMKAIQGSWNLSFFWTITALYCFNMFFQSLGAMSIVTTKMPWFHVRERGTFGTVFGIMISLGMYFAFDWEYAIRDATRAVIDPEKLNLTAKVFREILGTGGTGVNQSWWMFLFPALFGLFWFIPIALTLRNRPEDAGFKGFETGDEHISAESLTMMQMLKEVFLNPKHRVLMIVCLIEFCSGAIRNGSIHVFPKFAKNVGFRDDFWVTANWGLVLLIAGVLGANATGWVSDKMFNSRRGPMALVLYALVMIGICMITFSLGANAPKNGSLVTGIGIFIVLACIIGVHGILSGTASADFAGVKNTAKSVGIVDGAVYAGTSLQAFLMGMFIPIDDKTAAGKAILADPNNWLAWPVIILPFVVVGTILGMRIYHAYPNKSRSH